MFQLIQLSLSPSKDVPGFRRILPRANFLLPSQEYSSNQLPESSQAEFSGEHLNPSLEDRLPPDNPQLTELGLTSEVELPAGQKVIDDDGATETEVVPYPPEPCEIPSSPSAALPGAPPLLDVDRASKDSADSATSVVTLQGVESSVACHGYGGTLLQQGDTTQTVAIIPAPVRHHSTCQPFQSQRYGGCS